MTTETQNNDITLADLGSIKVIIELATQRGAFRANEMTAVGQTYDRLAGFLAAVQQSQAAPAESETEVAADANSTPAASE